MCIEWFGTGNLKRFLIEDMPLPSFYRGHRFGGMNEGVAGFILFLNNECIGKRFGIIYEKNDAPKACAKAALRKRQADVLNYLVPPQITRYLKTAHHSSPTPLLYQFQKIKTLSIQIDLQDSRR